MARKSQRLRRQKKIERLKAREQEARMSKNIEDNSVILERMKNMSSIIDEVCETITTPAPIVEVKAEPVPEVKPEASVEMRIQPHNEPTLIAPETPNFKKMTKRALLTYAKENEIAVKSIMTKAQLIKAIQETI
jgi:hypothetical protein